MQLIAEKKAAVLRAAAQSGSEKEISGKSLHDRDLLTLLIKANMSTDIPENQRLSDDDVLARTSQLPTRLSRSLTTIMPGRGTNVRTLSTSFNHCRLTNTPRFLVAGHETTSTGTAWALYALAQAPEVQAKLREELWSVPTENPTMDELNALPYLEAVVRETLRVHAPVSGTIRVAAKDDVVPLERPYVDTQGNVCDHIR